MASVSEPAANSIVNPASYPPVSNIFLLHKRQWLNKTNSHLDNLWLKINVVTKTNFLLIEMNLFNVK